MESWRPRQVFEKNKSYDLPGKEKNVNRKQTKFDKLDSFDLG